MAQELIRELKVGDCFYVKETIIPNSGDSEEDIDELRELECMLVTISRIERGFVNLYSIINPFKEEEEDFPYFLLLNDIDIESTNEWLRQDKYKKEAIKNEGLWSRLPSV